MNSSTDKLGEKEEEKPALFQRLKHALRSSPKTTEDMVAIVDAASENEVIDNDAKRIIEGALEVSEMHARDIMVPRTQMTFLKAGDTLEENLQKIIESAHSRYPVIGENIDEVLGILLAKDLLPLIFEKDALQPSQNTEANSRDNSNSGQDSKDNGGNSQHYINDLLRPAVFVPESKRLNILLRQFREDRNHMALVIDEYGTLAGLVTIEDVLEEIVGEIEDEHDAEEHAQIRRLSNSNYMIKALTPINEFNEFFATDFSDDEFDTIGGLVINQFGRLPKRNEKASLSGFTFHVTHADNRRLHAMRMTTGDNHSATPGDAEE